MPFLPVPDSLKHFHQLFAVLSPPRPGRDACVRQRSPLVGCVTSCHAHGAKACAVTPHTFRRSCATEMIRANASIYHVKELLGHETLKHYAKLSITDLRQTLATCHPREGDL